MVCGISEKSVIIVNQKFLNYLIAGYLIIVGIIGLGLIR